MPRGTRQSDRVVQTSKLNMIVFLTLLVLETDFSGLGINTMPDDALTPKIARASAGMVLAVMDRLLLES